MPPRCAWTHIKTKIFTPIAICVCLTSFFRKVHVHGSQSHRATTSFLDAQSIASARKWVRLQGSLRDTLCWPSGPYSGLIRWAAHRKPLNEDLWGSGFLFPRWLLQVNNIWQWRNPCPRQLNSLVFKVPIICPQFQCWSPEDNCCSSGESGLRWGEIGTQTLTNCGLHSEWHQDSQGLSCSAKFMLMLMVQGSHELKHLCSHSLITGREHPQTLMKMPVTGSSGPILMTRVAISAMGCPGNHCLMVQRSGHAHVAVQRCEVSQNEERPSGLH